MPLDNTQKMEKWYFKILLLSILNKTQVMAYKINIFAHLIWLLRGFEIAWAESK